MGKILKFAAPIIGALLAPATFGLSAAVGAGLGGAAAGLATGGGLKGALIGGATGYAGNVLGGSIAGSLSKGLGSVGSASLGRVASNAIGPSSFGNLGSSALNSIGNAVANTTVSSALGNYAGNSMANSLADSLAPQDAEKSPEITGPAPFNPSRSTQIDLPGSLSGYSDLDENQQSTNLANQGVYGGGIGSQEQAYFNNLINRRLVDDAGNVDSDLSELNPIETSYLDQQGFGNKKDPRGLLEALSKWKTA